MKVAQSIDTLNVDMGQMSVAQAIDALKVETFGLGNGRFSAVSPEDGVTGVDTSTGVLFDWSDSEGEGVYRLVASYNSDLSSPVINRVVEGTEYQYDSALTQKVYWELFEQTVTDRLAIKPILGDQDSSQGDFEALQAFYNATQGDGIPSVATEGDLPDVSTGVYPEYPYFRKVGNDIYRLTLGKNSEVGEWVNEGEPWLVKTGWDTMTVETMGDAVGVTVDADNRVTEVDLQKITAFDKADGYLTAGNNVCGELIPELGNLKRCEKFNIKQNFLYGTFPAEMGNMTAMKRMSLAGFDGEVDLDDQSAWYESVHVTLSNVVPELVRTTGYGADWTSGKRRAVSNIFRTELPPEWGALASLELIELNFQELQGKLPSEWGSLTSLRGYFMDSIPDNAGYPNRLYSEIPTSWGNWVNTRWFRVGSYQRTPSLYGSLPAGMANWDQIFNFFIADQAFTGAFPPFPDIANIYYFNISGNTFEGNFPWSSILDSATLQQKVNTLNKFNISNCGFTNPVPETDNDVSALSPFGAIYLGGNNFNCPMPAWMTRIRPQIFNIEGAGFVGDLPPDIHDMSANMYTNLRYLRAGNNGFTSSPPKTIFRKPKASGVVLGNDGANQVETDIDLGVLYTGTVTSADTGGAWIRDSNANWNEPWSDHEITIIVPDGSNIIGYSDEENSNFDQGFFYVRETADVSDTVGLTYEIRKTVVGRNAMFYKSGVDVHTAKVTDRSGQSLVLDQNVTVDIINYDVVLYDIRNDFLYVKFDNNNFDESIPVEWAGIRAVRSNFFLQANQNEMKGRLHPELSTIDTLDYFNVDDNRFTVDDFVDVLNAGMPELDYQSQKLVGQSDVIFYQGNETITIDNFNNLFTNSDNVYQWYRNNVAMTGETSKSLTVNVTESDTGDRFQLRVTNPNVTGLTTQTEIITIEYLEPQ